jgi:hypothetical protein
MSIVDLGPAAQRLADLVARVGDDELGQPAPCPSCTLGDLLAAAERFLSLFASPDAPAGPDVPFGPSRQVPAGAPELDRVDALAGRDSGWPAG